MKLSILSLNLSMFQFGKSTFLNLASFLHQDILLKVVETFLKMKYKQDLMLF